MADRRTDRTRAYQTALKQTREAVRMQLEQHYRAMPSLRDDEAKGFVQQAVRIVQAGQARAVALTSAHMSGQVGMTKPLPLDTSKIVAGIRQGVDAHDVYMRPIISARAAIEKDGFAQAFTKGLARLLATAEMDVAMSARDASVAFGQDDSTGVIGWIRVAEPSCCDFCQEIDGAKIFVDDPAPLHNNCGCTVDPIMGRGKTREREDWVNVSDGAQFDNVEIRQHGEMGPLITDKNDNFTSEADLPKSYFEQVDN